MVKMVDFMLCAFYHNLKKGLIASDGEGCGDTALQENGVVVHVII